tara:strand:- start:469 stop:630 length:162 start_codon:yes stop_codon:yes gene_type:complete
MEAGLVISTIIVLGYIFFIGKPQNDLYGMKSWGHPGIWFLIIMVVMAWLKLLD